MTSSADRNRRYRAEHEAWTAQDNVRRQRDYWRQEALAARADLYKIRKNLATALDLLADWA